MIKFFKKIRQRLLSENRIGRYLIYAIGEILIVITGILIAIQINNWNGLRKEEQVRKAYLNQLLVDFETDKTYYANRISLFETRAAEYKKYLDLYTIPNIDVPTIISGFQKIGFRTYTINFETTTINTLISTGDIKILPESIRNKLTHYHGLQNITKAVDEVNIGIANEILESLLTVVNQRLFTLQNQPQLSKYLDIERNLPKIIIGADSFMDMRQNGEDKTLESFKRLSNEADSIIAIINKYIKKVEQKIESDKSKLH